MPCRPEEDDSLLHGQLPEGVVDALLDPLVGHPLADERDFVGIPTVTHTRHFLGFWIHTDPPLSLR
jgi:hypothetical protein